MQDKILEILRRKNEYASGEEISESLKISRQALWKHIQELRDSGYDIVAVPHLGYQLAASPDKLLPAEIKHNLGTKLIAKNISFFDAVPSTNDVALNMGIEGAPEGTVVVAETQTKGKGRLGRSWSSPKHKGIYFSLILRPKISPAQSPVITLLVSSSICEAIKEVCGVEAKIKWPNDILLQNKKLGGILTEISAETDRVHFLVIGVGLNVNNEKNLSLPQAISLKEVTQEHVSRLNLMQEILRRIEQDYLTFQKEGSSAVINRWREYNSTLGKRVKVTSDNGHLEGIAVDIDSDGGLLIRNDAGLIRKVMAGDVTHCR
ncbi:MAG: biotin--[acetyl-CoA-carboxylase] ligase [Candidatus Omnitrophica bacterium]|jgi:BirA family biotin operon repressor/biotin-[acetyl-CoA-carboxylase] ligase|nr:biotin--[acetyl-CoA-carboxylase] ligase [Candidatus Omnitrophota bacterium]